VAKARSFGSLWSAEGTDHGGTVADLVLPPETSLAAEPRPDLLSGVKVITGKAQRLRDGGAPSPVALTAKPTEPVKGYHNGRWAACPQDRDRRPESLPKLQAYVQDVIRAHARDPRVLWWRCSTSPT